MMIELSRARRIFDEVVANAEELFDDLDGLDLPDMDDITDQPVGDRPSKSEMVRIRAERGQASRDLMMLGDRLAAIEAMVRDVYWTFRGEESVFDTRSERAS